MKVRVTYMVQLKTVRRGRRGGGYEWVALSVHRSREAADRAAARVRLPAHAHAALRVVEFLVAA